MKKKASNAKVTTRPRPRKIDAVWYRLEFLNDKCAWEDAGDVYEEETKRRCRAQMVCVNFWPHKVRMVEYFRGSRPIGKIKDMDKDCYRKRKVKRTNDAAGELRLPDSDDRKETK